MKKKPGTATHFFCRHCKSIQPIDFVQADPKATDGVYEGGTIICGRCKKHIISLYRVRE